MAALLSALTSKATAAVAAAGREYASADLTRASLLLARSMAPLLEQRRSSRDSPVQDTLPTTSGGAADGPRVGILATPSAETLVALCATWRAGGVAVPLATSHPPPELLHVFQDAGVSLVLAPSEFRGTLEPLAARCSAAFLPLPPAAAGGGALGPGGHGSAAQPVSSAGEGIAAPGRPLDADLSSGWRQAAVLMYTSGTTGRPKGVVHTHAGLAAQLAMLAEAWKYSANDRFLHCLPLHHVHGLYNGLLSPLYAGAQVEFMPRFSATGIWARWRASHLPPGGGSPTSPPITVFTGVPTMYVRLLQAFDAMAPHEQRSAADAASKLRLMMCGSAACPEPLMARWERVTGQRLLERYGMTEFGMGLSNPLEGERRAGFVGVPLPGVEAKLAPESGASGAGAATGTARSGELCIRSPSLLREYWGLPEATAKEFDCDGFFKTGDTAAVDEGGYYRILGRTSVDILKSAGYKLSALEIEATLLQHPRVAECAVMGVSSPEYGESIAAVVALHEGGPGGGGGGGGDGGATPPPLTLDGLRAWAADKMAPYKIPTVLRVVDHLPRNAMGKVNKKELRKALF